MSELWTRNTELNKQIAEAVSNRKLASIRRIAEIKVHPNADLLELAIVDGWQCVVKKDEFKVGDLVVYFEIDSVLPLRPEFEFLTKCCYRKNDWLPNKEGYRLRTIKLRGELSQGLVVPITQDLRIDIGYSDMNNIGRIPMVGDDITELLGVVKWDPPLPACLQGLARGNFPSFIRKTDQERIQNCWNKVKDNEDLFEVTIKLDGSSATYYHNNGDVGACSRNLELKLTGNDDNTFIQVATRIGLFEGLKQLGTNIAVQGEVIGPGIQGNRENLQQADFYVFDIFLIDERRHAIDAERNVIMDQLRQLGVQLKLVPLVGYVMMNSFSTVRDVLNAAEGPSLNNPVREGVVFKSTVIRNGEVVSFKAISDKYLLGEKE